MPTPLVTTPLPALARTMAVTFFATVLAGCYGLLVARSGDVVMVWPASAVGFTAVALYGYRVLPAVGAAAVIVGLALVRNPTAALAMAVPGVVEAAVSGALARWTRLDLRFSSMVSPLHLTTVATGAALSGAVAATAALVMVGDLSGVALPSTFLAWMMADVLGILTFAPALLAWLQPRAERPRPRGGELVGLIALAGTVCVLVLIDWPADRTFRTIPLAMAMTPVIMWTAMRADLRVASIVIVALTVSATLGVRLHTGALASPDGVRDVLNVQSFHLLVAGLTLLAVASTSQRERALTRSRESELQFAAVSDATADVQLLFAVEPQGVFRLVHINKAARSVALGLWPGSLPDLLIGRTAEEVGAVLPEFSGARLRDNVAKGLEAIRRREVIRFEDELRTPWGERATEVTITPIAGADGTVTHLLRTSMDISARKAAEASTRRFNEDLEQRVAERTHQLAAANRELESFGYSLSHDLRAPLRSVEGFSRAIIEDLEQGQLNEIGDHAARIHAASLRMYRLVDDLLRLSQLPTADLAVTDIDLTAMVEEVLRELRHADPGREVRVTVAPGMREHGDARLVLIAVQNLLANAWKYTSRHPAAAIEVGQDVVDGERVTFVRDNGVGFDPAFAQRLFAPFERLHKREEFDGAGIGLATVQRIVSAHGGRVWATSAPGQGATFRFTLRHGARAA